MTTATMTRGQKAAATRAANKAANKAAKLALETPLATPAELAADDAEIAACNAGAATPEAPEAADLIDAATPEAEATGYTGPMLKLRERLKAGKYVKAANGQPCCGDVIAILFGALKPEQTIAACVVALGCGHNPYTHLNIGQQSMNLRNRVRNAYKRGEFGFGVIREAVEEITGKTMEVDLSEAEDESEE